MMRTSQQGLHVQMRPQLLGLGRAAAARGRRLVVVPAAAAGSKKGFGGAPAQKQQQQQPQQQRKQARQRQQQAPQQRPLQVQAPAGAPVSQQFDALEEQRRAAEEEADFAARLATLKAEAAAKRAERGGGAASPDAAAAAKRAVFDGSPPATGAPSYDEPPPPLLETLGAKLQGDIADPALRNARIGPGQLGLAAGALLLGAVFVVAAGGDLAPSSSRYDAVRPARPPPDAIELAQLQQRAAGFEARLQQSPNDADALAGAAAAYAAMQDYSRAADAYEQLTAERRGDAEAWRLLGEARLLAAEAPAATKAYERAAQLAPRDARVVTGLVDAYVANGQQAAAVKYLTEQRTALLKAKATGAGDGQAGDDASSSSSSGSSSSGSSGSSDGAAAAAAPTMDPISVQLLLGRTYAAWRGHDADALAAYDAAAAAAPQDFRPPLAKGLLLRSRGRAGDAARAFLQARLAAPLEMRAYVDARAGEAPELLAPPPDNGLD